MADGGRDFARVSGSSAKHRRIQKRWDNEDFKGL